VASVRQGSAAAGDRSSSLVPHARRRGGGGSVLPRRLHCHKLTTRGRLCTVHGGGPDLRADSPGIMASSSPCKSQETCPTGHRCDTPQRECYRLNCSELQPGALRSVRDALAPRIVLPPPLRIQPNLCAVSHQTCARRERDRQLVVAQRRCRSLWTASAAQGDCDPGCPWSMRFIRCWSRSSSAWRARSR
jgi:hypothetical protein